MNINLQEALALLDTWRENRTPLRVHFSSRTSKPLELQVTITDISGQIVSLDAGSEQLKLELMDAEFNGDRVAPRNAAHGPYLICEFRNEDRWTFYAPRSA